MRLFEELLSVIERIVFGILGIWGANTILTAIGVGGMVGLNAVTLTILGILGMPGYFLLYAVSIFGRM